MNKKSTVLAQGPTLTETGNGLVCSIAGRQRGSWRQESLWDGWCVVVAGEVFCNQTTSGRNRALSFLQQVFFKKNDEYKICKNQIG